MTAPLLTSVGARLAIVATFFGTCRLLASQMHEAWYNARNKSWSLANFRAKWPNKTASICQSIRWRPVKIAVRSGTMSKHLDLALLICMQPPFSSCLFQDWCLLSGWGSPWDYTVHMTLQGKKIPPQFAQYSRRHYPRRYKRYKRNDESTSAALPMVDKTGMLQLVVYGQIAL